MWKLLAVARRALGDAQNRLVIADGRIDASVGDDGMTYVAAKRALEALEEEITKAADALKEIEDKFRMHPDTDRKMYSLRKDSDGVWAPPPTQEPGGDKRTGEPSPDVPPVPRSISWDSGGGGNDGGKEDESDRGCAKVDFPLSKPSFSYTRST